MTHQHIETKSHFP